MLDKIERAMLFVFFVFLAVLGGKMIVKVADPYTRKVSPSLADVLKTV